MHFNRNTVTCSREGGKKSLNGFKFGDFKVRFPSDGAASMAVIGLNGALEYDVTRDKLTYKSIKIGCLHCILFITGYI